MIRFRMLDFRHNIGGMSDLSMPATCVLVPRLFHPDGVHCAGSVLFFMGREERHKRHISDLVRFHTVFAWNKNVLVLTGLCR